MKRYDEKILGILLDKYEKSLLYTGTNRINRSVSVPIQKSILPEYFDESAMQFDVIHDQLEQLEDGGYLRLFWKNKKRGHILEKCELVTERADDAYRLLHRKPKNKKEQDILNICGRYQGKAEDLDAFLAWIRTRLQENESVRKYVDIDEPKQFERLCELILRILTNDSECFLRQFSIRWFHDSKIAEKEIEKAAHIISEYSTRERIRDLTAEEVLEEHNIYRNPSWLMMKGNVTVKKKQGKKVSIIDLSVFPGGLGFSNQDIGEIFWDAQTRPEQIVTIENLTSFHQWKYPDHGTVLCIYLGGYHNRAKRLFLKKLYESYPDAAYSHFGDIDCGGFLIWKDLCVKTGIPFQTLLMDLPTYTQYLEWGRELTGQDRKTLIVMLEDPFFQEQRELFERMLKEGVKLEQECIRSYYG